MIKKGEISVGDVFYSPRTLGIIPLDITKPLRIDKHIVTNIREYEWGIYLDSIMVTEDATYGTVEHHFGTRADKAYKSIEDLKFLLERIMEGSRKKKEAEISKLQRELMELSTYDLEIIDNTQGTPIYNKSED